MTLEMKTELKEWQLSAVTKLIGLRVGALYMDMGTGKTRTALELAKIRLDKDKIDRVLWFCPYSIQKNLTDDLDKHCDGWESIIKVCGIETLSSSIKKNAELLRYVAEYRVFLVVDESSLVKNHKALRSESIERIAMKCPYRVILNGTPISKNEKDLYMQWRILDWRILGYKSFWSFSANHLEYDERGRIRRCLNVSTLTDKIAPYTYQVKREECMTLPEKSHWSYGFGMGDRYEEYLHTMNEYLDLVDDWIPATLYKMFSALQIVACGKTILSNPADKMWSVPAYDDPKENPRMICLTELIKDDIKTEKCIIFCKYTDEIKDIFQVLTESGYTCAKFHGEMTKKQRDASLKIFQTEAQFLIANKSCAAFGLNLQFCHIEIFYSNDWDYATRIQAEDRVHRLGQEHNVIIWDIYARNTIDEHISNCLTRKANLLDQFQNDIKGKTDKKGALRELLCPKST
jgi:SNF2 family DNA or RNA helicase